MPNLCIISFMCCWICEHSVPEQGCLPHTTSSLPLCVDSLHKEGVGAQACWPQLLRWCDYLVIWPCTQLSPWSATFWKQHHWSYEGVHLWLLPLHSHTGQAIIQRWQVGPARLSLLSLPAQWVNTWGRGSAQGCSLRCHRSHCWAEYLNWPTCTSTLHISCCVKMSSLKFYSLKGLSVS